MNYDSFMFCITTIRQTALLFSNRQESLDFLNSIAKQNFIDNITRPDTKWKIA